MADFKKAYDFTKKWEGGYVNHPNDPGGETNWGITAAVARSNGYTGPIKEMPQEFAEKVYKLKYWDTCNCDGLSQEFATAVFDTAVNCGVSRARSWKATEPTLEAFIVRRLRHYENLIGFKPGFAVFKRGWFNRLDALALLCLGISNFTKDRHEEN